MEAQREAVAQEGLQIGRRHSELIPQGAETEHDVPQPYVDARDMFEHLLRSAFGAEDRHELVVVGSPRGVGGSPCARDEQLDFGVVGGVPKGGGIQARQVGGQFRAAAEQLECGPEPVGNDAHRQVHLVGAAGFLVELHDDNALDVRASIVERLLQWRTPILSHAQDDASRVLCEQL